MGHQDPSRQHRLDAGLCFRCGKAPHLPGRTRCEDCAEKDSQRARKERGKSIGWSAKPLTRKERGAAMQSQIAGQVKQAAHDRTPFNKMPVVRLVPKPRVIVIQDKSSGPQPVPRKIEIAEREMPSVVIL